MSWLEDLEARLEQQLEQFLQNSPVQEARMADQERRDRLAQLRRERLALQEQAERERQALLALAEEIRRWQQRVARARTAGAEDLASRAEAHVAALMEQGRRRWQELAELGQRFQALETKIAAIEAQVAAGATAASGEGQTRPTTPPDSSADLDQAWAAFEAEQELEQLKARLRHPS